jgi:prophage regulatory protein
MKRLPAKSKGPIRMGSVPERSHANHSRSVAAAPAVAVPAATATWPGHERRQMPPVQQPFPMLKLLRFAAVQERTGLSRSTIWRLEQRGAFPRHRRISSNTVAWVEGEVTAWIRAKVGDIAV